MARETLTEQVARLQGALSEERLLSKSRWEELDRLEAERDALLSRLDEAAKQNDTLKAEMAGVVAAAADSVIAMEQRTANADRHANKLVAELKQVRKALATRKGKQLSAEQYIGTVKAERDGYKREAEALRAALAARTHTVCVGSSDTTPYRPLVPATTAEDLAKRLRRLEAMHLSPRECYTVAGDDHDLDDEQMQSIRQREAEGEARREGGR
jgi:chromosome segregation ATPase